LVPLGKKLNSFSRETQIMDLYFEVFKSYRLLEVDKTDFKCGANSIRETEFTELIIIYYYIA